VACRCRWHGSIQAAHQAVEEARASASHRKRLHRDKAPCPAVTDPNFRARSLDFFRFCPRLRRRASTTRSSQVFEEIVSRSAHVETTRAERLDRTIPLATLELRGKLANVLCRLRCAQNFEEIMPDELCTKFVCLWCSCHHLHLLRDAGVPPQPACSELPPVFRIVTTVGGHCQSVTWPLR
jgi:hypothetical protein